jgi:hypothetical protein
MFDFFWLPSFGTTKGSGKAHAAQAIPAQPGTLIWANI